MTEAAAQSGRARRALERRLRRAWRKERRFHHVHGACHVLLWTAALVLVDLLIDWLFLVPGWGRVALLGLNGGVLAVVAYRAWWRHLRRYDAVRVALQVEQRHPELRSVLVSYVQVGDDAPPAAGFSPALVRAMRREAVRQAEPINFREIVRFADLRRIAVFSVVTLAAFGGISVNWSDFFRTLLLRMVHPGADLSYPTRTRIDRIAAPRTVREGDGVQIEAACSGMVPAEGTLQYRPGEGEGEDVPLRRDAAGVFRFARPAVYQDFSFRVRVGDDRSAWRGVRVIPPPRIVEAAVRVRTPAYLRQDERDLRELNLEVPEGTVLTWHVRCDRALKAAHLLREDGKPMAMDLDADRRGAGATLTAGESFYYRFEWTDRDHGYTYPGAVQYFVQVLPDGPPTAELLRPTEDEKATIRKKLTLRFRARDDHGLAAARIVYQVGDRPEESLPVAGVAGTPVEKAFVWALADTVPALKVGDTLTYAVEVRDARKTGLAEPNVARTRPLRVSIVTLEDYLRYIQEKKARLVKEIRAMHEEESTASEQVGTIGSDFTLATQPATRPAAEDPNTTPRPIE